MNFERLNKYRIQEDDTATRAGETHVTETSKFDSLHASSKDADTINEEFTNISSNLPVWASSNSEDDTSLAHSKPVSVAVAESTVAVPQTTLSSSGLAVSTSALPTVPVSHQTCIPTSADCDEEIDDEFDLQFQSSDASLIASKAGSNLKSCHQPDSKPSPQPPLHNILNTVLTSPASYHAQIDEGDDDADGWAEVDFGGDAGVASSPMAAQTTSFEPVSYEAALLHFRGLCREVSSSVGPPPITSNGCCACLSLLGIGEPVLDESGSSYKDLIISIAATPFSENDLNVAILKTIFWRLKGGKSVMRFGKHWEEIGFQGTNPATDLRGVGLLGLICILNWFKREESSSLALAAFRLSLDPIQNFPFCVMSINVTRLCLQQLKAGNLNREILRYVEWRDGRKTITNSGFVLKALEKDWAKFPSKCIKAFEIGDAKKTKTKSHGKKTDQRKTNQDPVGAFTNLSDL